MEVSFCLAGALDDPASPDLPAADANDRAVLGSEKAARVILRILRARSQEAVKPSPRRLQEYTAEYVGQQLVSARSRFAPANATSEISVARGPGTDHLLVSSPDSFDLLNMFKRVERKRKRREEEEELGIDEEMKEALGMGGLDTDSDESKSDSDSDHSNDEGEEDADEVLGGVDGEDEDEGSEGDDASDADEGDSSADPAAEVFTIGELMSSSPIVQLPDKGGHFTCVVCPGKVLRTKEFIDQHLESQPHTRRMARLATYVKTHKPEPTTDAFDILDKVDEEKEQAAPAPGTSKKADKRERFRQRRAEARARKQAKAAKAKVAGADGADDAEKAKAAKTSDAGADAKPSSSKKKHLSASRQRRIERRAAARAAGEAGESSAPAAQAKEKEPLKETQGTTPRESNGKALNNPPKPKKPSKDSTESQKKPPMSVTKRAAAAIAKSKSGDKKDKPAKKRKLSHV